MIIFCDDNYSQSESQEEFIDEAASKSLKEVKDWNKSQKQLSDKEKMSHIKRYISKRIDIKTDGENKNLIRFDVFKPDDYDKNRDFYKDQCITWEYFNNIKKRLPANFLSQDRGKIRYDENVVRVFQSFLDAFGIDKKKYGISINTSDDRISVKTFEYGTDRNRLDPKDYSKYVFIHFSHTPGWKSINPSYGSRFFNVNYAHKSVFVFGVAKNNLRANIAGLKSFLSTFNYGRYAYQYIPKQTDNIFLDPTDVGSNDALHKLVVNGFAPMFIETNNPLPVTDATRNIPALKHTDKKDRKIARQKHYKGRSINIEDVDICSRRYDDIMTIVAKRKTGHDVSDSKILDVFTRLKSEIGDLYKDFPIDQRRTAIQNTYKYFKHRCIDKIDTFVHWYKEKDKYDDHPIYLKDGDTLRFIPNFNKLFDRAKDSKYFNESGEFMMNEDMIYQRIKVILDRMDQKKQLQALAKENGLPINELELNQDTEDAVVLSVIALMLSKMDNDKRYHDLCTFGMQKRTTKVDIINDYKQQAIMLYNKYKAQQSAPVEETT